MSTPLPAPVGPLRPAAPARRWVTTVALLVLLAPATALVVWTIGRGWFHRMGPSEDGIAWRTDLAAAQAESRRTGKPLLIDFSSDWCDACQIMRHETWPTVRDRVNADFIPVAIDANNAAARDLGMRYGITTIPAVVIADADLTPRRRAGFLTAPQMQHYLEYSPLPTTTRAF